MQLFMIRVCGGATVVRLENKSCPACADGRAFGCRKCGGSGKSGVERLPIRLLGEAYISKATKSRDGKSFSYSLLDGTLYVAKVDDVEVLPQQMPSCPSCMCERATSVDRLGLATCNSCGGLISTRVLTEEDANAIVSPYMTGEDPPGGLEACQYFDLKYTADSDGSMKRRHGWFDPTSRLTVQSG